MQAINAAALDTISACGDVNRTPRPAIPSSRLHAKCTAGRSGCQAFCQDPRLLRDLPDHEKLADSGQEEEPICSEPTCAQLRWRGTHSDGTCSPTTSGWWRSSTTTAHWRLQRLMAAWAHGKPDLPAPGQRDQFRAAEPVLKIAEAAIVAGDLGDQVERSTPASSTPSTTTAWNDRGADGAHAGFALEPAQPFQFERNSDAGWTRSEDGRWRLTLSLLRAYATCQRRPAHRTARDRARAPGRVPATNQNLVIAGVPE